MRLISGLGVLLVSSLCWSDRLPDFFASNNASSTDLLTAANDTTMSEFDQEFLSQERKFYVGEDRPKHEDSVWNHDLYEDDSFRIYNNTQYNLDGVKSRYAQAQANQVTYEDLSISLGYGMEFNLSPYQSVGYEYISSFPHDRGQSVRLFWKLQF